MHCLAAGVYSRPTKEELRIFLKELDLVVVDLDECIFPKITKVALYKNICLLLMGSGQLKDWVLLGRLLRGAVMMVLMRLVQKLCLGITNRQLIFYFARVIRPVPVPYLQRAVESIPGESYAGARQTLEVLSKKARVGIISQGLDVVLNEYVRQFSSQGKNTIDFWDGNILSGLITAREGPGAGKNFILNSHDKEAPTRKRIAQFKAKRIIVIGHNSDDLVMIRVVREHKGMVVGFNPTKGIRKLCDIVVIGKSWMGLRQIVQELMEAAV